MSEKRWRIEFSPQAKETLSKLRDKKLVARIEKVISALEINPRPMGSIKLSGEEDVYRLRISDWRVIYSVEDDILLVLILEIGQRKDIYRRR